MVKVAIAPSEKSIAALVVIEPPISVASQLKILTPVGTATSIVVSITMKRNSGSVPEVNIWWPSTINEISPIEPMA